MKHPDVGPYNFITDSVVWTRGLFLLFFITLSVNLSGQEKGKEGLVPLTTTSTYAITRSLVVGISDYQHPAIPDLHFAHRDANAFAEYLKQTITDTISTNHIELFLNENATAASIQGSLQNIQEESSWGDKVILYFSGHGDMENANNKSAYLLCYDAAYTNYSLGGTLSFAYLQNWVNKMNKQGVSVQLFMDACHAGNLAGNSINGPGLTAKLFRDSLATDIKYLACSPSESSLESHTWGDGHGAFTYYLIQGISGMADQDNDGIVSRWELQTFLDENVVSTTGNLQHPLGPTDHLEEPISYVDTSLLHRMQTNTQQEFKMIGAFEIRSFENRLLTDLDSSLREDWKRLKASLQSRQFFAPENQCAEYYYNHLIERKNLSLTFKRYVTRTYVAGLLDDGQQALKAILDADTRVISGGKELINEYEDHPKLFFRAAEILGERNDLYSMVKSRGFLFQGMIAYMQNSAFRDSSSIQKVMSVLEQSRTLERNSALTYHYIALCQIVQMRQPDMAIQSAIKAHQLSPHWLVPLTHIAYQLCRPPYSRFQDAKNLLDQAFTLNEFDPTAWIVLGCLYHYMYNSVKAIEAFKKAIELDSTYAIAWTNLGVEYFIEKEFDQSRLAYTKALQLNPKQSAAWHSLGCLAMAQDKNVEAIEHFKQALLINPNLIPTRDSLASAFIAMKMYNEATSECEFILNLRPNYAEAYYKLAKISFYKSNRIKTKEYLTSCLDNDSSYKNRIISDDNLRAFLEE